MASYSKIWVLVLLAFLSCNGVKNQPESITERKQLFDFDWKFMLGNHPEAINGQFDDTGWRSVNLPHDWSIEGDIMQDNETGTDGGFFPAGMGWYRKSFVAPEAWKDKEVQIYFEGVYMNSEVFINGTSLGIRPYGYSSFAYNLTPHLKIGEENILSVKVDNAQQINCRWYSGSGIYRHTWLMITDKLHIKHWGVKITTPKINEGEAEVILNTQIVNNTGSQQAFKIITQITGPDKVSAQLVETDVKIDTGITQEVSQTAKVSMPQLWSPDSPNLYTATITLLKGSKKIDQFTQNFGIRSIEYSVEKGFVLNGKPVIINGGCVHHDNGCLGAEAFDRAEQRRVELLKAAGFNAMRTSHNPPSEAFLDECDKQGLLVVDEAFDGWRTSKKPHDYSKYFDDWATRDAQDMVLRDYNHPSIVMWSIGNEIIERNSPEAVETAYMLANAIKELDTTRAITSAMTTWDEKWAEHDPLMAAHDVAGYNYQLFRAPSDHERVPSRIILNTESYPINAFNIWKLATENSYIIGDFVWTAMDYLGESGIGGYYYPGEDAGEHWVGNRFPWHGAYCGDIDLMGWRKPISHYRDMLYNADHKLYMAVREPSPAEGEIRLTSWAVWPTWDTWTWPGHEGKAIQVDVYSKYEKVALYLNDSLVDTKKTGIEEQFKAIFTLPYAPGTLKAVGLDGDEEKESFLLQTAGEEHIINFEPDRAEIMADGQDLSFVTIKITDKQGIVQHHASDTLSFEIEGPGEIAGITNAHLKGAISYASLSREVWNGKVMVVIRSSREPGDIILKVNSDKLEDAQVTIKAVAR